MSEGERRTVPATSPGPIHIRMPELSHPRDERAARTFKDCLGGGSAHSLDPRNEPSISLSDTRVPTCVRNVVGTPGLPLDSASRAGMESSFGHDFGRVRVHCDEAATRSARAMEADAFTVGNHIVFDASRWTPISPTGRQLLSHELTHVVDQEHGGPRIQRQTRARFPVVEELLIQGAEITGALEGGGRRLTTEELSVARRIFGGSVNFSRVRILQTTLVVDGATFGYQIRVDPKLYREHWSNRILVHELTHVWQYQNRGSGYITDSALHQAAAIFSGQTRGGAYDFAQQLDPKKSFLDFSAEHQARIVESFYAGEIPPGWEVQFARWIREMRTIRPLPEAVRSGLMVPPGPSVPGRTEGPIMRSIFQLEF